MVEWRRRWIVLLLAACAGELLLAGCAGEAAPMLEAGEYQLEVSMSSCFSCTRMPSFEMGPDGRFRGNGLDADACCEGMLSEEELVLLTDRLNEANALRRDDGTGCIDCGIYRFDVLVPEPEGEPTAHHFRVASTALDPELEAVLEVVDSVLRAREAAGECEPCPPPTGG